MQSEQQQRIMGYFIEEAKDHLNTIEQGLVSLQSTMEDTEMVNEIFRAAHSVKGGAAMLGLNGIQKTAHRLEDCFKVLKESPIKADNHLESLFLQVFDTLQALIDQLQSSWSLTDETVGDIMLDTESVFEELNAHLEKLVKQAESSHIATAETPKETLAKSQLSTEDKTMLPITFKRTVLVELREMLQLFKQQDSPEHRQALQEHCERLRQLGEQSDLAGWGELVETAKAAIAFEPNSYRQLAGIAIKEIKQAQELVVAGRSVEVAPSETLKSLVPTHSAINSKTASETNFTTESSSPQAAEEDSSTAFLSSTDWFNSPESDHKKNSAQELNDGNFTQDLLGIEDLGLETQQDSFHYPIDTPPSQSDTIDLQLNFANGTSQVDESSEPEVGMAELNSLADIFEGQNPDLDQTWQEEEIISLDDKASERDSSNLFSVDNSIDFSELINENNDGLEMSAPEASASDDLMSWLSDDSTEEITPPSHESLDSLFSDELDLETSSSTTPHAAAGSTNVETSEFSDLIFETYTPDLPTTTTNPDDLNSLFGDSFFEENSSLEENSEDFGFDADAMPKLQQDDDLFGLPAVAEGNDVDVYHLEEAEFSLSPNTSDLSADQPDYLNERLTEDTNESWDFDDSFGLELEEIGSDETQQNKAPALESEFDLGDMLELSDSDRINEELTPSKAPELARLDSSTPQNNQAFIEELVIDDEAADFSFDDWTSAQSSASPHNLEEQRSGDIDNLFENESFSPSEVRENAAVESLDGLDDFFSSSPEDTEAQADEALNFDTLEEGESIPDFDALNDFFDTQSEATDTSAEQTLEFEEFSLFEMPPATDNVEVRTDESQSELELETLLGDETPVETNALDLSSNESDVLDFEEDLFADKASSSDWNFETQEEPTRREEPAAFLDFDEEVASAKSPQASDLELLLGDETPIDIDALELSSDAPNGLNLEEDLLPNTASSQEWDFDTQPELTTEEPAAFLDFDEEVALVESPQASDIELLLGDETPIDIDALELSSDAPNGLNLEEDLLPNTASSEEWDFDTQPELTTEEPAAFLDFDEEVALVESPQTLDLESLLGNETIDRSASLENLSFETHEQETPQVLELNWETTDSAQAAVEDDFSFLTAEEGDQSLEVQWDSLDEFEDLGSVLSEAPNLDQSEIDSLESDRISIQPLGHDHSISPALHSLEEQNFADLEELVLEMPGASENHEASLELAELDDLDALLGEASLTTAAPSANLEAFDDLEALLGEPMPDAAQSPAPVKSAAIEADTIQDDEFGDLEILLEQAEKTMGGPQTTSADQRQTRPLSRQRPKIFEQTMRVPVKHLDSLSNLVGELVVNRNSLEQDQEQLRQFLDNLSHQVLALSDVGSRMQDLYERTLLESSLLASRYSNRSSSLLSSDSFEENNSSGVEYDPLEMDRFTGFHLLSQEMIELIVRVRESASDIELLVDGTDQVARMLRQVTTQLQEGLTRSRMVPFAQTADRLPRAVREISIKLRKQAELHVEGRETLIDKMILEHLYDPLTHLVNNAITHGIEAPDIRKAAGKSPIGKITLRAFHQGNQTVISISDDGAGIDPEKVRRKAIEKRLITAADAQSLTNLDLYDFLFRPGFTTKDKADDFSGRGVGMDVVRTSLSEIRGVVHIDSGIGKGTTFTIRLPLTLSICKALCCLSDRARIAFPMDGVEDMLDLPSERIETNSEGQTCIQWRDMLLPFQSLSELLTYKRQLSRNTVYGGKREDDIISIVVLRSAGNFLAIQVDQVLGEQEIVIKQLEGPPPKPVGIAGATVLGDGRIMPIADVLELIDLAQGRIRKDTVTIWSREELHEQVPEELPATKAEPLVLIVDDSITVRELLSMTFTKAGYRVEQARDGQDAWDKLRSGLPCDIVFCDIEMPRMDGLELLSRLQKDENLTNLPIAMLTSRGADRHRQMAAQLGASGYFTKPYLEEVLLDAAQRMIKGDVLF